MEDAYLAQHYGIKPTSTIASNLGRTCAAVYGAPGRTGRKRTSAS